jgi:hypothetical protein
MTGFIALGATYLVGAALSLVTGRRTTLGGILQILTFCAIITAAGYFCDTTIARYRREWATRTNRRS